MNGYYEIEFENVVDLIKVSREMKQQLFIDKTYQVRVKLWFAAISEHGLCVLNSCYSSQKEIDEVFELLNREAPGNPTPEPIEAAFHYWER